MEQSILKSTKKVLQVAEDDDSFDLDIMTHINSAFSTLHDIGVGPVDGFTIDDVESTWADFVSDEDPVQQSRVKSFVILHTRLLFDPPTSTFLLASVQTQLQEVTWRLSVKREETDWRDPDPVVIESEDIFGEEIVIDGGGA